MWAIVLLRLNKNEIPVQKTYETGMVLLKKKMMLLSQSISFPDATVCFSINVTGWLSVNMILTNFISEKKNGHITCHPESTIKLKLPCINLHLVLITESEWILFNKRSQLCVWNYNLLT